jgi:5-methylcytosine-specific restriction endonuclease McrA
LFGKGPGGFITVGIDRRPFIMQATLDDEQAVDPPLRGLADSRVLVLDAGYRPVTVIGWQRAVILLLDERAEAVVERDEMISSPSLSIFLPSVIRLTHCSIPAGRRRVGLARKRAVHERDRWTCAYCGWHARTSSERVKLTIDHVMPKSRGGSNIEPLNLVSACGPCNRRKRDRTPEEARMQLLFPPREPSWAERVRWSITAGRSVPEDWAPFLLYA